MNDNGHNKPRPRDTRRSSSSRRHRHPEMDPDPIESLRSSTPPAASESQILTLDAIDVLAADMSELGVELDEHARAFFLKLVDHPCRKCPHLVLVHPEVDGSRAEYGPVDAMPVPACRVMPTWSHDPVTGEISLQMRETWDRCPLYGVTDVVGLFRSLEKRVERLEKK